MVFYKILFIFNIENIDILFVSSIGNVAGMLPQTLISKSFYLNIKVFK